MILNDALSTVFREQFRAHNLLSAATIVLEVERRLRRPEMQSEMVRYRVSLQNTSTI
jgi:hypothetical protein